MRWRISKGKPTATPSVRMKLGGGKRRVTELKEVSVFDEYRHAYGVYNLMKCMSGKPRDGHAYHIITGGHVDLLAHLGWLMVHWPRIESLMMSCWAISGANILLLEGMLQRGEIGHLTLIVGDVFKSKYVMEWRKLQELEQSGLIDGVYCANIHSKYMLIRTDDGHKIVVESSANCNMNPRVEQTVVTLNGGLYDFYASYYLGMMAGREFRRRVADGIKDGRNTEIERLASENEAIRLQVVELLNQLKDEEKENQA